MKNGSTAPFWSSGLSEAIVTGIADSTAHRATSGEPAAGRQLKAWAQEAGFTDVRASASVWLYESPEERAWWGGMWADRVLQSAFSEVALSEGIADRAALERISAAWREWAAADDGWILLPHGETLARG